MNCNYGVITLLAINGSCAPPFRGPRTPTRAPRFLLSRVLCQGPKPFYFSLESEPAGACIGPSSAAQTASDDVIRARGCVYIRGMWPEPFLYTAAALLMNLCEDGTEGGKFAAQTQAVLERGMGMGLVDSETEPKLSLRRQQACSHASFIRKCDVVIEKISRKCHHEKADNGC